MHPSTLHGVLEHLRKLTDPGRVRELSDADLLERFRLRREEAAFTLLVQRHGPMVLAVCRRILGDVHEAEDVFQATFLVLIRKAATIRKQQSLASWLHIVATRLAQKARAQSARRQACEREMVPLTESDDSLAALTAAELRTALDEEIERLPAKYRLPVVLCYLAERTHEQAAQELGWSKSSVTARLAKARELLQRRLRHRGFTAPAGLLAALLTEQTASAVVPSLLTLSTVRLSVQTLISKTLNATTAVVLADSIIKGTNAAKWTAVMALLTTMGFAVAFGPRMASSLFPSLQQKAQHKSPSIENRGEKQIRKSKPRVDRFGDPLPEEAVARLGTVRFRHGGWVRSVAFSPDGKSLASGGQDNTVRLWEIATGKQIRRFTVATGLESEQAWVQSVAFSPDGKFLAAGTGNSSADLVMWELDAGKEIRRFPVNRRPVESIAFSPDGKALAAGILDGSIQLWKAGTGELLRRFQAHKQVVEAIAFAPDGKMLASASRDKTIRFWDTATWRELRQLEGHTDMVVAVAFSPDGKMLASGSWDNTIRLWITATGKELRVLKGHAGAVSTLGFFPDGKTLASGSWDHSIRLWDASAGKELRSMQGNFGTVPSIAVSPDGKMLASGSWDRTVRIWDAATGKERRPTEGNQSGLWAVAVSPDGKRVATGGEEGIVRLWDAVSGNELLAIGGYLIPRPGITGELRMLSWDRLQFAADGKAITVSSGFSLGRWDSQSGKQIQQKRYNPAQGLCPTPDGKLIIGSDTQGSFLLMDALTGWKIRSLKSSQRDSIFRISPDGKFLACGSPQQDGTLVVWELATGKEYCRCKGAPHLVTALSFSPDGKYLAGSTANMRSYNPETPIYLWDAATGREVRRFQARGHVVTCLTYSSDGRMLASGGGDKTVRLWEIATGKERQCFEGHQGVVRSVAFSAAGWRLASASDDTTALVWNTTGLPRTVNLTVKEVQGLWTDLASADAAVAFQVIRRLIAIPEQTVSMLRENLKPVPAPDLKRVRQLVDMLESTNFPMRQKAADELEKRADAASSLLRQIVEKEKPALEVRRSLQQILDAQEHSPETLRAVRAVEVLEWIAMPDALRLIDELANGAADARLTREAVAARGRMRK